MAIAGHFRVLDGVGEGRENDFSRNFYDITCSDGVSCVVGFDLTIRRVCCSIPSPRLPALPDLSAGNRDSSVVQSSSSLAGRIHALCVR